MTDHPTPTPARDLTDEERAERLHLCTVLDREVKTELRKTREQTWKQAEVLYRFQEAHAWTALGYSGPNGLARWLAEPEVDMSYETYKKMVHAWREVVVLRNADRYTYTDLSVSKVDIVLAAVKAGTARLADALADAQDKTAAQLRAKYQQPRVEAPKLPRPDVRVPPPPLRDGAPMDDYVAVPPPPGPSYAEQNGNGAAPMWSAPVAPPSVPLCGGCTVKDRALRLVQEYLEGKDDAEALRVVVGEALDV